VNDQHGAPTWSRTIADTSALVLAQAQAGGAGWWDRHGGMYHLSSQGQTTWCGFTEAIVAASGASCKVTPITSAQYPVPARRPGNSVLDSSKMMATLCRLPDWREALALCLA